MNGEDAALRRLLDDRFYVSIALAAALCLLVSAAWLDARLMLALPLSIGALAFLFARGKLERFPEKRDDDLYY